MDWKPATLSDNAPDLMPQAETGPLEFKLDRGSRFFVEAARAEIERRKSMSHVAYHNTTPLVGEELIEAARTAQRQDDLVLAIMRDRVSRTPSEVHAILLSAGRADLITSVRRALTNLTRAKLLRQTGALIDGPHGRPENQWVIVEVQP